MLKEYLFDRLMHCKVCDFPREVQIWEREDYSRYFICKTCEATSDESVNQLRMMTKEDALERGFKVKYLDSASIGGYRGISNAYNYDNPRTAIMRKVKELGYTKEDIGVRIIIERLEGSRYGGFYEIYEINRDHKIKITIKNGENM